MGIGVLVRLPQRACLVSVQLLAGPLIAPAQPVPATQGTQDHSQVAAPQSVFILGIGKATRRPDGLWASGHDRLVVSWRGLQVLAVLVGVDLAAGQPLGQDLLRVEPWLLVGLGLLVGLAGVP